MQEPAWQPWRNGQRPATPGLARIIGHRGAASRAPENTLAGIRKAHALGARWVEFDVMLSGDAVPILIHDERLGRTTNGRGPVASRTAAEIRALDAGGWFSPEFKGERVPTLDEAVDLLLELGLGCNAEIKPAKGHEVATGEVVAETLARRWPEDGPPLLLSSFARPALAAARRVAPDLPRGLLAHRLPDDWPEAMTSLGCTTLHLDHARTSLATIARLTGAGVPVLLYTVNQVSRAVELLAAGAAALFTDVPDTLLAALPAQ